MKFFQHLVQQTELDQQQFLNRPIIQETLSGQVSLRRYQSFLCQAYHHVKHTIPLLMACGSRLPEPYHWLQKAIAEYIEEEIGHEEWILSDLKHCDVDPEIVRTARPHAETELLVAYAYHQIDRGNPLAFFGMVHVLEGSSTALATQAAGLIQEKLHLPDDAFSYLRSHGILDLEHVKFFEQLMDRIDAPADQAAIIHAASMFYRLYGGVLSSVEE